MEDTLDDDMSNDSNDTRVELTRSTGVHEEDDEVHSDKDQANVGHEYQSSTHWVDFH